MAENKIQYINRTYDEYRNSLINITRKYYPDVFENLDDAAIGQWLIDIISDIGDNLNYHLDRVVQETSIDSATQISSLQNIARTNGLRLPGRKAALCEVEISCELPLYTQGATSDGNLSIADESYAPLIKRGTLFSTGMVTFELTKDVNFKEQFDENGISNRQIIPTRDSNGNIVSYTYKKLAVVVAGQSKIYKKVLTSDDVKPFMEILIQDSNILGVDSIIVKQGSNLSSDPLIQEFNVDEETWDDKMGNPIQRYFEVDNLIDQYRYGYETEKDEDGKVLPIWVDVDSSIYNGDELVGYTTVSRVMKGKWKRIKQKFITEYTDNWQMKVIFGAGIRNKYGEIPTDAKEFTQYMMSRMEANDYMGVLPEAGNTMYVLYRVGGGEMSNIAAGTLTSITYLNASIEGNCDDNQNAKKKRSVKNSLKVTNTTPSYGGKDEPNSSELRYMIKYNSTSQNRAVTIDDYYALINKIPAQYGCPFRVGIAEENNKIGIYTLGLDHNGKLTNMLAETVADNIKEYLRMYKTVNDFIEIKSGKIINLSFQITAYIDKTYDKAEVTKRIIETVEDYMDIQKHQMGEDIYVGDLQKELSKLDGVSNIVSVRIYNKTDEGYSDDEITQELVNIADCCYSDEYGEGDQDNVNEIDLKASDYILFSECNSMFEIKYPDRDIVVNAKTRG